jgi:3-hydroxybutyryl-CoA dehydratase
MLKNKNKALSIKEIKVGDRAHFIVHIKDKDISDFALLSNDMSAIHMDREKARQAGFSDRVAHGTLISSYFSAIVGVYLPGDTALLMQTENKFHRPVYPNTKLHITGVVSDVHVSLGCIEISMKATDDDDLRLASGKWLVKVRDL